MATAIPSRPARTWRLRNPRNDDGEPLTAEERVVCPSADIYRLIGAIVAQAVADLDAVNAAVRRWARSAALAALV